MKRLGIGGVVIMEVDVGIPRGPVRFMSPEWRQHFEHVLAEATRLGIEIDLNAGPGWTGSGSPWIKPEQSMQQITASETNVVGPGPVTVMLPQPPVREGFYRDVAVLAFPTPIGNARITDVREKALFVRGHYSSESHVPERIQAPARPVEVPVNQTIPLEQVLDLSRSMDSNGRLQWDAPTGSWTILRFGHTSTGANTRPAPEPGLGLECDKLDRAALEAHFDAFVGQLLANVGPAAAQSLVSLHIDSWEMGPQNWTVRFPEEFKQRRGYDLRRYLPIVTGRVIDSVAVSERFLWDLRQTVQDLIVDNYAGHLSTLGKRRGPAPIHRTVRLERRAMISPMGARADVPMCEFWANCFDTFFTCAEATSIAHTYGRKIVAAEAFTADDQERWLMHPATLKPLGDWSFAEGINRIVFHRYAHQPWLDRWPGMTMGPYGVHYERTQTWWELAHAWHQYLTRCQFLLQQGLPVADVLYLMPEAASRSWHAWY